MKATILLLISLCFTMMMQAQVSKTANVTAGNLKTILTGDELSTVTNLTLSGTIDARDFKTMRDDMAALAVLDLSSASVAAYTGTEATGGTYNTSYPANSIPYSAFYNQNSEKGKISLTSVLLPSTITSIGDGAFTECSGLTSIPLPTSLTSIGAYAFAICNKLTAIKIPAGAKTIGNVAFAGCSGLITVDADNPNYSSLDGALFNKTRTNIIFCPTSKTGNFTIPSSVTSIGYGAFYGCDGLTSVSIPESVTAIDYIAFFGCSGLTSIDVNSGLPIELKPELDVFSGVNKIKCTLNVPFGAKGLYAKANVWNEFTNITEEKNGFQVGTTFVKIAAIKGSSATVNLAANVPWTASSNQNWLKVDPASGTSNQTLTFTAEANDSELSRSAKITFSAIGYASQILTVSQDGINKTINVKAGGLLSALTGVELSGISDLKLTGVIDARDFKILRDSMPNLSILDLTDVKVTSYTGADGTNDYISTYPVNAIPAYAFVNPKTNKGKISLTKVELPLSILSIEYNAFKGCSGITSIGIPSLVTTIGYDAFAYCTGLASVNIPSSVTLIDVGAFKNSGTMLSVDGGNMYYSSINGVLFNKDKTTLIYCPISKTGNYTIPSSVISIGYSAFQSCRSLTNINIPFSVASVSGSAFNNCTGLISVDSDNQNYSGIDGVLFNKNATTLIKCPVSKSGSYVIPAKVSVIGDQAFYYCNQLTSVTIPTSVTTISNGAFDYCTGLTSINANSRYPVKIDSYTYIFEHVNQTTCTLNVPFGAKKFYAAAGQWKEFTNIVEQPTGFILSSTFLKLDAAEGSRDTVNIKANVPWTASSNQAWLKINPISGSGNNTFIFVAEENKSLAVRIANVTVSATGFDSHIVTVSQDGSPKTINTEVGSLHNQITSKEISNLIVTGTMDARDFKFLRDSMPSLTDLDLSNVTIVAYSGSEGTYYSSDYLANSIPQYAFYNTYVYPPKSNLTSVILPSSINSIGEYAFNYCTGLTSIILPSSVTLIGNSAFGNCTGLTSIVAESSYPADLTSVYSVFMGVDQAKCTLSVPYQSKKLYAEAAQWKDFANIFEKSKGFYITLTNISLSSDAGSTANATIKSNVTWTASSTQSWLSISPASGSGDKTIYFSAEANTLELTRTAVVTISAPDIASQNITVRQEGLPGKINLEAGKLSSVFSENKLKLINGLIISGTIDARDFKTMRDKMPLLSTIDLKDAKVVEYSGIEGTGEYSVYNYPENEIPQYAFSNLNNVGNKSLKSITFPSSITSIGLHAFMDCSGLRSVVIPKSVKFIGKSAFNLCVGVNSVTFDSPSVLQNIGIYGFRACSGLTSVILPSSITQVDYGAFYDCNLLSSILFDSNSMVEKIDNYAFRGCSALTSFKVPAKVDTIGYGAFYQCEKLNKLEFESNSELNYIGFYAFGLCPGLTSFTIFKSVNFIGDVAFLGTNATVTVDKDNLYYTTVDGILYDKAQTRLMYCPVSSVGQLVIPSTVKSIAVDAFYNCSGLTGFTLPFSLTSIEDWAFENCTGLTTISVPSSVNFIGNSAFHNCSGLTSIFANSSVPVDLSSKVDVFFQVNKSNCILYVPYKSKNAYKTASQWKDFINVTEAFSGINLSANKLIISESEGSTVKVEVEANVPWNAVSDQSWIEFNPASGYGVNTINFTAKGNTSVIPRPVKVTISADGIQSQYITIIQSGAPKTIDIEAGGLLSALTSEELNNITNLTVSGTIDARDFKTIRDKMPLLKVLDLSGVTIVAYSGTEGTSYQMEYPANTIPESSFYDTNTGKGKTGLTAVVLPSSVIAIGNNAFKNCTGLTTMNIPSMVNSIGYGVFWYCSGLTSIYVNSGIPVDLSSSWGVFEGINKTNCILNVPFGSKNMYVAAFQWQDFKNIIEAEKGFTVIPKTLNIAASAGSLAYVTIIANVKWNASCDQSWLTVKPGSEADNDTLTITVQGNKLPIARKAIVTISATDFPSQTINVMQEASSDPLPVTAGKLKTLFTIAELGSITKLKLSGTIDARDFKTMRDDMPLLAELDLSVVTIKEYVGTKGTYWELGAIITYPANEIPIFAFHNEKFINTTLASVILPVNATSIGWDAFYCVTKLTSIVIPPTITSIDVNAFAGCPFYKVTIPSSVIWIGVVAFSGSNYIYVEPDNPKYCSVDGVLFNKNKTTIMQVPYSKTGSFIIPPSVTRIDDHAFEYCRQLTSIKIPSSVTSISHFAFLACINLTSITIPSQVTFLGDWAFSDCTGLTSIYSRALVPLDLSNSKNVFLNVNKTTCTLYVPTGTKELYKTANFWKDFQNIVEYSFLDVPDGYVNIESKEGSKAEVLINSNVDWKASSNVSWLTVNPATGSNSQKLIFTANENASRTYRKAQVTVSANGFDPKIIYITQLGSNAPLSVTAGKLKQSLTANELGLINKLTLKGTIDARDFKTMRDDMPNLAEIDLSGATIVEYTGTEGTAGYNIKYPANEIPQFAFYNLNNYSGKAFLTSFILPASVISIGEYAFQSCSGLTSFNITSKVTSIKEGAFFGFKGVFTVDSGNQNYVYSDGVLFNKNQTRIIKCTSTKTGIYNIPSSVTSIGNGAFLFCNGLTSVNIPSSIVSIGNWAFQHCYGLTSIIVNSSVPTDLNFSYDVFYGVNQNICSLKVPYGSKNIYSTSNQWKDFANIIEDTKGFLPSSTLINLTSEEGSSDSLKITGNVLWTVNSDQSWLTLNPKSGKDNLILNFTAKANPSNSSRIAKVTISSAGLPSQQITILQDGPVLVKDIIADYPLQSDGKDKTGNNKIMTLENTSFQNGGINCNGIFDYDGIPSTCSALTPFVKDLNLNSFLISVDFYVTEFKRQPVLVCGVSSRWLGFHLTGDGKVDLLYNNSTHLTSSKTYTLNQWHNVKITYDGLIVKMFIDNSLACYVTTSLDIFGIDTQIGVTNFSTSEVLKGYIKNLQIYNLQTPKLSLSATIVHLTKEEGSKTAVNITSNIDWKVSCDQLWLSIDSTAGTGNKTLTFTAKANPDHKVRMANLVVSGKGVEQQTILVMQDSIPTGVNDISESSTQFKCYPNPFNSVTTIAWQLAENSRVTLKVLDIVGRTIATLVDEQQPQGKYEIQFNAGTLPKGIYFFQLKAGKFSQTKKMILVE